MSAGILSTTKISFCVVCVRLFQELSRLKDDSDSCDHSDVSILLWPETARQMSRLVMVGGSYPSDGELPVCQALTGNVMMLQLGLWAQLPLVLSTQGPSRSVQPDGLVEMLRSRQREMEGAGQPGPVGLGDLFLIQSLPGVRDRGYKPAPRPGPRAGWRIWSNAERSPGARVETRVHVPIEDCSLCLQVCM